MELTTQKCVPCEGGVPPLRGKALQDFASQLTLSWELIEEKIIRHTFKFKNFKEGVAFINKVADIAEAEGHHPDLNLFGYNKVTVTLMTHAINGLSANDFILAAKIETLI